MCVQWAGDSQFPEKGFLSQGFDTANVQLTHGLQFVRFT